MASPRKTRLEAELRARSIAQYEAIRAKRPGYSLRAYARCNAADAYDYADVTSDRHHGSEMPKLKTERTIHSFHFLPFSYYGRILERSLQAGEAGRVNCKFARPGK